MWKFIGWRMRYSSGLQWHGVQHKRAFRYVWPLALLLLTACNGFGIKTGPGTSVVVVKPPRDLAQPVAEPQLQGATNGALAQWADELREALREANRRLRAIGNL